jgi:hypothetical protein
MRVRTSTLVFLFAAMLFGCASSHVMIGQARPAIAPDAVRIYLRPPAKYQEIALIEASSRATMAITDQGKMDKAIQRLREEAASLGANGVLLQGAGDQTAGVYNTSNATVTGAGNTSNVYATGVGVPINIKVANGIAIYVEQE